jgi:hypothetical protein
MREDTKDALKITNQYRAKGGMEYWLKCEGVHLRLLVSPRSNDMDAGDWHVEARAGRTADDAPVLGEWGATRIDALRAVGRTWSSSQDRSGLPPFDWDAVAKALQDVKAL